MNNEQSENKKGLNYRLVKYFLGNPQITLLLFLMLVITGVGAFMQMRVEGFPEIKVPIAIVTTVVPGAGPETVQTTVTTPLENSFKDLKGLKETSSTSQTNFSVIVLNFDESVDTNIAVQDAKTKALSVKLPDGVQASNIIVPETGSAPFFVAVSGGTDLISLKRNSEVLKTEIMKIKGVKSFDEISGIEEKIYIDVITTKRF